MKYGIRQVVSEYKRHTLFPLHKAAWLWIKNRDVRYSLENQENWHKYKTSDTIFLFGSGPSINDITTEQWDVIRVHDSFGLNYFFLTKFPTTYFYLGYEPSSHPILLKSFSEEIRALYKDTLWFVPVKMLFRLTHPRIAPELFPLNTKIALFDLQPGINLEINRPFKADDFRMTISYRGTIGVGMHLVDLLGYKNIVLMGVDLHTYKHFYDNYEVMKKEREETYQKIKSLGNCSFEDLLPDKQSKSRTIEEYYYAVSKLYLKPKGVQLYVGNKNNILSPRIPFYQGFG